MNPNTPMKITVTRIITYSCRPWMSAAIGDAAGCRFHSSPSARPENAAARTASIQVAVLRAVLLPIAAPSRLGLYSFRQLRGEFDAALPLQVPPDLIFEAIRAEPNTRGIPVPRHAHPRRAHRHLVALGPPCARNFDRQALAGALDALVVGGMPAVREERSGKQRDFDSCERQHQPGPCCRESDPDPERHCHEEREHPCEGCGRDRAVPLQEHAEARRRPCKNQLAPRILHCRPFRIQHAATERGKLPQTGGPPQETRRGGARSKRTIERPSAACLGCAFQAWP